MKKNKKTGLIYIPFWYCIPFFLFVISLASCTDYSLVDPGYKFKNIDYPKYYGLPLEFINEDLVLLEEDLMRFEDSIGGELILDNREDERMSREIWPDSYESRPGCRSHSLIYAINDTANDIVIFHYYEFVSKVKYVDTTYPENRACNVEFIVLYNKELREQTEQDKYEYYCKINYVSKRWLKESLKYFDLVDYQSKDSSTSGYGKIMDENDYLNEIPYYRLEDTLDKRSYYWVYLNAYSYQFSDVLKDKGYQVGRVNAALKLNLFGSHCKSDPFYIYRQ